MANGILSLIQPNGSDKFNLRAESIFYFKPDTSGTTTPASGYVSCNTASQTMYFAHDNIMSIQDGMLIAFESPANWDYNNVIFISNGTKLNTTPLTIVNNNANVHPDFKTGEWFIMVLMGTTFHIINPHIVNQVSNSYRAVSAYAVKTYVDGLIANRFTYVLSNSAATTPNATKYGTTQGTLAASQNTEYKIYLVSHTHETGKDVYDEWITVKNGSTYSWEKIGNTDMTIDIDGIITDIASHTFTPSGTVSKPTFTGDKVTTDSKGAHTHSVTATGNVSSTFSGTETTLSGTTEGHQHTIAAQGITVKGSVTAAGSVSQPTFTGSESTTSTEPAHSHQISAGAISVSGTFNPSTIAITAGGFTGTEATINMTNSSAIPTSNTEHTHTISNKGITISSEVTAAGTVSKPTFTGTAATIESTNAEDIVSTSESHSHTIAANGISVSSTYTPAGTVSTPTITVTPSATVYSMTGAGTASSYTVSNEVLTLTPSTVPTRSSVTFSGSSTQPTFTGTQATITSKNSAAVSISGGAHTHQIKAGTVNVSGEYTPAGSVSQPTFTGTKVTATGYNSNDITITGGEHKHNITAAAISLSTKYTPAGTIANPTITSTSVSVTSTNAAAITTGNAGGHSHTVTAAGTVSKPTFTGSSVTVTSTNEAAVTTSKVTDNVEIDYTPAGTITSTFTGTAATTDSKGAHTHDVTATGTVSQPTFSGTQTTLTHTKKS